MIYSVYILIFFIFTFVAHCANPFLMDLKQYYYRELSHDDYKEIQKKLETIDISTFIRESYDQDASIYNLSSFQDFYNRITKGINQKIIDEKNGLFPKKELIKIGRGGDRCVVCYVSMNGKYPDYLKTFINRLKEVGFNGYCLSYLGGWPNPTGKEIKYIAIPYSFKLFAMLEASMKGFTNVLWVDSACYPLKNIEPLFDYIKSNGALFHLIKDPKREVRYILSPAFNLLENITGIDVESASNYINASVLGFKMDRSDVQDILKEFQEFLELGIPFLSCYPEEYILTSILNQKKYQSLLNRTFPNLEIRSNEEETMAEFEKWRLLNFYFYNRKGR